MRLGKVIQNYKGWRILTTCYLPFLPPFFCQKPWRLLSLHLSSSSPLSFPANLAAGARGGLNMAFPIPSHPKASHPMVVSNSRTSHTFHPRTFGGPESMVALTCASIRQQKKLVIPCVVFFCCWGSLTLGSYLQTSTLFHNMSCNFWFVFWCFFY